VKVLELGHNYGVTAMRSITNRVLSQDQKGHWALWDSSSDSELASGDQAYPWPVDMAGSTIAVGQYNGIEVRSSTDGHVLSVIAAPGMIDPVVSSGQTWWMLASDGSYICAGSSAGLAAWSPAGQQMLFRRGDYSSANAFAAPGQIQVALGPAGQNVIETIALNSGASSVGSSFLGSFNSWFVDGQNYLTNTGNTVWTYSASSVQEGIVSLPSIAGLSGEGTWIWTYSQSAVQPAVSIYAVGANSPSATYNVSTDTIVISSGTTLGILPYGNGSGSVVDLSGTSPVKTDFTTPFAYLSAFTATTATNWFVANQHGVIADGSSPNVAQTLDMGQEWSITGGTTRIAIATANESITYLNPATPTSTSNIAFSSSKLVLSTDDTVLAAAANAKDAQYEPDRTLNIFSLPSSTVTTSFPYSFTSGSVLFDFSLSGGGTVLGQLTGVLNGQTWQYSRTVSPVSGGTPTWSDPAPYNQPIQLSPDGTLIAVSNGGPAAGTTTNIFQNGVLVGAASGWAVGWLDNSRLLVNTYTSSNTIPPYAGAVIYSSSGTQLSTSAIPELSRIQALGGDQIYSPDENTIFSISSGQPVWTATQLSTDGAVAGSYVVFSAGSQILLDTH
jgi:hypothetical protein